ncbi:MAG: hypothetical protein HUU08_00235 [Candidatus Brocadia sp.]|nr:hypothetical protein [Candidatus Brocadia sp.]
MRWWQTTAIDRSVFEIVRFPGCPFIGKNKGTGMKSLDKLKDTVRDIAK